MSTISLLIIMNTNIISTFAKVLSLIGLIAHALVIFWLWDLIPKIIPCHYDFLGNIDAWCEKTFLLFLLAVNAAAFFGLDWLGNNPQKFNYPWEINESNKENQYWMASIFAQIMRFEVVWILTLTSLNTIYFAINGTHFFSTFWVAPLIIMTLGFTVIGWLVVSWKYR